MSLRFLAICLLCFMNVHNSFSQEKYYQSQLLGLGLKLSEFTEVKNFRIEDSDNELYIVLTPQKALKYTLTITKKKDEVNFLKIKERDEYKKAYLQQCNCTIEAETFHKFEKFTVYRLKTITKANNTSLYGYADSFMFNGNMYSLIYLTDSVSKFKNYFQDYDTMLKLIEKHIE